MIFLLLCLTAADSGDNIKELKEIERNMLDEIDSAIRERRLLEKRSKLLRGQLEGLEQIVSRAGQRLEEDAAAYARAETDARKRARQMDKLLRGQAARFVLGADGLAEGIRRTRIIERAFRRDAQLLGRALQAVSARRAIMSALSADRLRALDLVESAKMLRSDIEAKTKELASALTDIRGKRSSEERQYYDLREFEARIARETEEENVAATDAFASMKARLKWPVTGSLAQVSGGVSISSGAGAEVHAVAPGTVEWAGPVDGYAKVMIVRHSSNFTSIYGHLASFAKTPGDAVEVGTTLGTLSAAGSLHFEIRRHVMPESPEQWLEQR